MIAMNEVFEYRRFGALARKYYRENRRLGIIFLGIIGIITFLCLCKFNPFLREYTQVENPAEVSDFIQYYKGVYRQLFWGLYGLFALVVALHSLRDFVVKDKILNTLLLPASVFEKYVLAFLNSTVVLLVVYLLMFYAFHSSVLSGHTKYSSGTHPPKSRTHSRFRYEPLPVRESWQGPDSRNSRLHTPID